VAGRAAGSGGGEGRAGLGTEISEPFPEPVPGTADVHDVGVVEQAIEERDGDDLVANTLPHSWKGLVRRQDEAPPLVAALTSWKSKFGPAGASGGSRPRRGPVACSQ